MTTDSENERRLVRAGDLKPAAYNPRAISDEALEGLRNSVSRFGIVQPLVVNEREDGELRVVGGHQRIRALNPDPDDELDVVVVHLSDAEEKALNLALNSGALSGTWTLDLKIVLDEVRAELPDLSADLRLPELELDVPLFDDGGAGAQPPGEFKSYDESLETEYQCPKCGYEWSGKRK